MTIKGKCYGGWNSGKRNRWMLCVVCDGRIHDTTCTAKVTSKDCSPARHKRMGLPIESAQIRQRRTQDALDTPSAVSNVVADKIGAPVI